MINRGIAQESPVRILIQTFTASNELERPVSAKTLILVGATPAPDSLHLDLSQPLPLEPL